MSRALDATTDLEAVLRVCDLVEAHALDIGVHDSDWAFLARVINVFAGVPAPPPAGTPSHLSLVRVEGQP